MALTRAAYEGGWATRSSVIALFTILMLHLIGSHQFDFPYSWIALLPSRPILTA